MNAWRLTPGSLLLAVFLLLGVVPHVHGKWIMAYYMPWFSARPYHQAWGWHWTMDRFNPDSTNLLGQREIASWYYPLIGPYDSSDPAVLEYHVLLMKLAGIDGVVVDWYGSTDFLDYGSNNDAVKRLFQFTRKAGLKFAVCYEDQTMRHLIDANDLTSSAAIAQARADMKYLQAHWFGDSTYLRYHGHPVLLNFGPQYFHGETEWKSIFSTLDATNQPAFFTEDNRGPVSLGAFDWPPMWLSQAPGTGGVLSDAALQGYLAAFAQKSASWPASISSAFPRFHDVYSRAADMDYLGYIGDHHGDTFRETLALALTNSSFMTQVVTWNDFGEGTMIEPTEEYGFTNLVMIQDLRRAFLQPDFPFQQADLQIPLHIYQLRRAHGTDPLMAHALDQIAGHLISGNLALARKELRVLEQ